MLERDEVNIQRLVEWIVNNADYGDITELCEELNVPEEWFGQFYDDSEWEEDEDDYDEYEEEEDE